MGDMADMHAECWGEDCPESWGDEFPSESSYCDEGRLLTECRLCGARVILEARSFRERRFKILQPGSNRLHKCKKLDPKAEFDDLTV